jgi:hypothetical protein
MSSQETLLVPLCTPKLFDASIHIARRYSTLRPSHRYDDQGHKVRYFADDDGVDLDTLVKRTKHGDDADANLDRTFQHNIARRARRVRQAPLCRPPVWGSAASQLPWAYAPAPVSMVLQQTWS